MVPLLLALSLKEKYAKGLLVTSMIQHCIQKTRNYTSAGVDAEHGIGNVEGRQEWRQQFEKV